MNNEEINKKKEEELINTIPESLKDYVYIHNGEVYAKQKLPKELEEEYNKFQEKLKNL